MRAPPERQLRISELTTESDREFPQNGTEQCQTSQIIRANDAQTAHCPLIDEQTDTSEPFSMQSIIGMEYMC